MPHCKSVIASICLAPALEGITGEGVGSLEGGSTISVALWQAFDGHAVVVAGLQRLATSRRNTTSVGLHPCAHPQMELSVSSRFRWHS